MNGLVYMVVSFHMEELLIFSIIATLDMISFNVCKYIFFMTDRTREDGPTHQPTSNFLAQSRPNSNVFRPKDINKLGMLRLPKDRTTYNCTCLDKSFTLLNNSLEK